jgi:catechol 2,3-dioxygenase-like lactoylglutathione lyase family enzyme
MSNKRRPIKALGEIVLRVKNIEKMREFYENIIGLELLKRFDEDIVFFKVAPGYAGHTQVLGLFAESIPSDHRLRVFTGLDAQTSSLHHIAFAISQEDFGTEKERMENLGLVVETQEHEWAFWRSLYVVDPEGNLVELVCYDASMQVLYN